MLIVADETIDLQNGEGLDLTETIQKLFKSLLSICNNPVTSPQVLLQLKITTVASFSPNYSIVTQQCTFDKRLAIREKIGGKVGVEERSLSCKCVEISLPTMCP